MEKLKLWLKNIFARVANFFRKIINIPQHGWHFIKNAWKNWRSDTKMLWSVAEVAEYFEVFILSCVLIVTAIKKAWKKMIRHIEMIRKTRFQLAFAGGGSWIDRTIYFGEV